MDKGQGSDEQMLIGTCFSRPEKVFEADIESLGQCPCCGLISCTKEVCMFCEERVNNSSCDQDKNFSGVVGPGTHTQTHTLPGPQNFESLQPFSQQGNSQNPSASSILGSHVEQDGQEGMAATSSGGRRRSPPAVDDPADQSSLDGNPSRTEKVFWQCTPLKTPGAEDGKSPEGRVDDIHGGPRDEGKPEFLHRPADEPGRGDDPSRLRTRCRGNDGFWQAREHDIPRSCSTTSELCDLGEDHSSGVRQLQLASAKVCSLASSRSKCYEGEACQEAQSESGFQHIERGKFRDVGCLRWGAITSSQALVEKWQEVENLKKDLEQQMFQVQKKEKELEIEKAELNHTEGRHKNRKET